MYAKGQRPGRSSGKVCQMLTDNAASFVLLTTVLVVHAMVMIATAMLYERCVWKIVD